MRKEWGRNEEGMRKKWGRNEEEMRKDYCGRNYKQLNWGEKIVTGKIKSLLILDWQTVFLLCFVNIMININDIDSEIISSLISYNYFRNRSNLSLIWFVISTSGYNPEFPASSPFVTSIGATQGPELGLPEIACTTRHRWRGSSWNRTNRSPWRIRWLLICPSLLPLSFSLHLSFSISLSLSLSHTLSISLSLSLFLSLSLSLSDRKSVV